MSRAIEQLRAEILAKVAEAAAKGLVDEVTTLAALAKDCDVALQTTKNLEAQVERIREELRNMDHPMANPGGPSYLKRTTGVAEKHSRKAGGREWGRHNREIWLAGAKRNCNVELRCLGEVTYQTASGKRVGIPYASEAPQRTYPWWLGLPDVQPYYVVLLCETTGGQLLDFVLDHPCVSRIWRSLSRDGNHHVKFHVKRNGPNWELKLMDGPLVLLNEYHRPDAAAVLR